MPELPEVETVCRGLAPKIQGATIDKVKLAVKKLRFAIPGQLEKSLEKQSITAVERKAKYIVLSLSSKQKLIVHLGMSGRFYLVDKKKYQPQKHDHMLISFRDSEQLLVFNDPRRFGLIDLTDDVESYSLFKSLGVEPLTNDFNVKYLTGVLAKRSRDIKACIMDSKLVVGVGNIYASESLFLSGIDPRRSADSLTETELKKLVPAIKKVLRAAIKSGGSSLKDYRQADGQLGYFQHNFKVYGQAQKNCKKCKSKIEQIKQNGRSSFFCPHCQS